jgi:minor extracellular serine protease Vpr
VNGTSRIVALCLLAVGVGCGDAVNAPDQITQKSAGDLVTATPRTTQARAAANEFADAITVTDNAASAASDEEINVFVKLDGASVSEVRATAFNNQISESERETIIENLSSQQNRVAPGIEAMGGRVLNKYQRVLNGVKVRIAVSRMPSLLGLPGVVGIKQVGRYEMNNATSVPLIGAPAVWQGDATHPGFHGEGIKIGIVDTGLDYTHANFGGPGTAASYNAAHGGPAGQPGTAEKLPADPTLFGPTAVTKVKGGFDFVGDDYDAAAPPLSKKTPNPKTIPHPDSNPLDCNGHGSHVGGTAAGFGVTAEGVKYTGSYDATTPGNSFKIGPGVAPKADLYAYRVFGCTGSTDVVAEALEQAEEDRVDVVNMSLGSPFGTEDSSSAEAATHLEMAGTIVACSAGNSGSAPYITGSPGTGERVISTAAFDSKAPQALPAANVALNTGTIKVEVSNGASFTSITGNVLVVPPAAGATGPGLGCVDSDYANAQDKIVITFRGTCARIYRVQAGFKHGAKAVVMVNNNITDVPLGYPPFEGTIPSCIQGAPPDNSSGRPCDPNETPVDVTIPFFGALQTDRTKARTATGSATATPTDPIPNPAFHAIASFSSGGPRSGYNANGLRAQSGHLKANLAAPGVNIISTGVGTGNDSSTLSGTSMASPHVAGVAALALQAHPGWNRDDVRIAVVNTADASQVNFYDPRNAGGGLVQPLPATRTAIVARGDTGTHCPPRDSAHCGEGDLSLGALDLTSDFSATHSILVRNLGTERIALNVTVDKHSASVPHTIAVTPTTFTLAGGSSTRLRVAITVPAASAGDSSLFNQVAGLIHITPAATGANGGAAAHVPYFIPTHGRSNVSAKLQRPFRPTDPPSNLLVSRVFVQNNNNITGTADFYAFGLSSGNDYIPFGLRAVGVQSFPRPNSTDNYLVFAVNTYKPVSTAAAFRVNINIYRSAIEVTDNSPSFTVLMDDLGRLTTGSSNGQAAVAAINNTTQAGTIRFLATAPTDGSTFELPVRASDVGVTGASPRFQYDANITFVAADDTSPLNITTDTTAPAKAWFNAFNPSLDVAGPAGTFSVVGPFERQVLPISIRSDEWVKTPTAGVMIVDLENSNSGRNKQALILKIGEQEDDEDREDRLTAARY